MTVARSPRRPSLGRPALLALMAAALGAGTLVTLPARANETIDWLQQVEASRTAPKSRAEVVADTRAAQRAGQLDRWNEGASPSLAVQTAMGMPDERSRADVRAEAWRAARDVTASRSEQPTVTAPAGLDDGVMRVGVGTSDTRSGE